MEGGGKGLPNETTAKNCVGLFPYSPFTRISKYSRARHSTTIFSLKRTDFPQTRDTLILVMESGLGLRRIIFLISRKS
jgi:hypothetical protein